MFFLCAVHQHINSPTWSRRGPRACAVFRAFRFQTGGWTVGWAAPGLSPCHMLGEPLALQLVFSLISRVHVHTYSGMSRFNQRNLNSTPACGRDNDTEGHHIQEACTLFHLSNFLCLLTGRRTYLSLPRLSFTVMISVTGLETSPKEKTNVGKNGSKRFSGISTVFSIC